MNKARYIRVSSKDQNNARQLAKAYPDELLFIDVCSGGVAFSNRPQAKELLVKIHYNQISSISVSSVDRLGRNAFDIQSTINYLNEKQINLRIDNLGIESFVNGKQNSIFKMIVDVLANVSQMERESLLERQREGIKIAIEKGTYKGRVKGSFESDEEILIKYKSVVKELKMNPKLSLQKIATLCNDSLNKGDKKLSPNTVRKVKNILEKSNKKISD